MTAHQIQRINESSISRYKFVIALVLLPVALALYTTGMELSSVPAALTSGVFPIGFTLMSWGIAAKLVQNLRK